MEEVVDKIRVCRRRLNQVFKMLKKELNLDDTFVDSRLLEELSLLAKTEDDLTDIIYLIFDEENKYKNS
jgi:hypothetical protein